MYYLDDSILIGSNYDECATNVEATTELLLKAGFIINHSKSSMIPSRCIKFLGFYLDSVGMTVSLPSEKKNTIINMCQNMLSESSFTIRYVAKVIGTLVAALPAVQYGLCIIDI